ncbi:MAG TPA: L-aspartate oxidase [Ktedonobacteraceae bacterium]
MALDMAQKIAHTQTFDVAIIGGGIAGLSVALRLPEHTRIALFTKGQLGESNTRYAQGGLAAALGADDSPDLHLQDTIAAGAGLCDEEAVRILVENAPAAVKWLIQHGVRFDRAQSDNDTSDTSATSATNSTHATPDGLILGREAAHSRWRVIHAGGDATGAEIERALMASLQKRPDIVLYEDTYVSDLLVQDGVCTGVEAIDKSGHTFTITAHATVLANGGAGGLWLHTSNPSGATADGLALAWRAGAALTDLEFMQFHPTVLVAGGGSHLISEAVRGEGAYLRNHAGERFMLRYGPRAELEPRDVVARAILSEMLAENTDCQYLDLRHLPAEKMHTRFPTISAICRQYGLDLARDLLPVAPAAHYYMGGVIVDTNGRTTLPALYAVGEVACTGVHGANRLASNSLLEGLVFGLLLADALQHPDTLNNLPSMVGAIPCGRPGAATAMNPHGISGANGRPGSASEAHRTSYIVGATLAVALVRDGRPGAANTVADMLAANDCPAKLTTPASISQINREIRGIMWQYASLCRDEQGLLEARRRVQTLRQSLPALVSAGKDLPKWTETRNMLLMAELIIIAALQRRESRGSHWRSDYNRLDEALTGFHYAYINEIPEPIFNIPRQEVLSHA